MAIAAHGYGIEEPVLAPTSVAVVVAGELTANELVGTLNPNQLVAELILNELTN